MRRIRLAAVLAAAAVAGMITTQAAAAPRIGVPDGNKIWNGYVTKITKTSTASYVQANWTVPDTKCPGPFHTTSASMWVGLGGVNTPVIQVGVETLCSNGIRVIAPVWEVTPPQKHVQIIFHTVKAGDLIFASIQHGHGRHSRDYYLTLSDNNRKWLVWTKTVTGPKAPAREADWIVEAGGKPLANFGTTEFTNCLYQTPGSGPKFLGHAVKYEAGTKHGNQTSVSKVTNHSQTFKIKYLRP